MLCDKSVSIEHQGKLDLQRHCCGKLKANLLNVKRKQGPISAHFLPQGSNIFPDSKIAKAYSNGKNKGSCILSCATALDLQSILIEQMKTFCYIIATDGSIEK